MSAQLKYGFSTVIGAAGGIVDIAPYAIDTFQNEENTGKMVFGVGVVKGSVPGDKVALPTSAATAAKFEGIVTNDRTTEYDLEGELSLRKGASVGVMRYGRVYARVAEDVAPAYGDAAYLITSGDEAGYFTNAAAGNDDDFTTIAVKGRFLGKVDTSAQVAEVELFNQAQA